jgi:mRNA interferase MazF
MAARVSRYQQKEKVSAVRRGELYLVGFDPTVEHEVRKTRPALILQNDVGNQYSPLTIVAAVTSKVSAAPFPVEVVVERTRENGLSVRSAIRLDRIRTIDQRRLIRLLGTVDRDTMRKVGEAVKISLGLVVF